MPTLKLVYELALWGQFVNLWKDLFVVYFYNKTSLVYRNKYYVLHIPSPKPPLKEEQENNTHKKWLEKAYNK